jgi:hypothetical protein
MPARFLGLLLLLCVCAQAAAQAPLPAAVPAAGQGPAAAHESRQPTADEIGARIDELIRQLGDERYEVREAATRDLAAIGNRARLPLERAAMSADPEIAFRARSVIKGLPKLTHTVVDALGSPIGLAVVTVSIWRGASAGGQPPAEGLAPQVITEDDGRVAFPEETAGDVRASATIRHPDYGRARCDVALSGKQAIVRLPLVRRGSEAHRRSVTGRLVTADGKPIAGAVVQCSEVRTPGEGLIEGAEPRGEVLSDEEGQFAYYLPPSEVRKAERGELIPANSRYGLRITVPSDDSFFPVAGRYSNVEPVRIELPRNTRFHRFRFEAVAGGWMEDPQQLRQVRVQYDGRQGGERFLIDLGQESIATGRKLLPGTYVAECFDNGKTIAYLPLVVTADSPEELSFTLPHPLAYRGRVVHGVTGKPVADALVMGWRSTSRNNLALLTADDWKMLGETPSNPPLDHPAIKRLNEFYGVQGLVRTDRDGRFEITRQPDQEFYGIMAFAEDSIPFKVSVGALKPDRNHRVDTGEFPLFPAAKILVRPVFAGERLSVSPRWLPRESGQPDWYHRFEAASKSSDRECEYVHWLALNELQPVFVPAGIHLRVRFEMPYDDQWTPTVVEELQLEPRTTKEIGDLHFAASLPAVARVIDRNGKPVEGVPVRRMYAGENAWCVAHNTDGGGLAHFYVHPNSTGQFWVSDLPGPKEVRMAENLLTGFKVSDQAPHEPFTITITDAQIELLLGARRSAPQPPKPGGQ